MQELVILKIGGSVATDKNSSAYTLQTDLLRLIFNALARVKNNNPYLQLILIHGAGGHVHSLAHTYDLGAGVGTDEHKKAGALKTMAAVQKLHAEVMEIGLQSLPLQSIHTNRVVTQTSKKISNFDLQSIKTAFEQKLIPVLYGDMVHDTEIGMSICSGDALAAYLSTQLPVRKIFFATDVDGIYTDDPHRNPHASLVESFTLSEINTITLRGSHNTDTTDGLRGKVNACKELFDHASSLSEIHIFNGNESQNYTKVFTSTPFAHTRIRQ